jgi:hypothetical protein
LFILVMIISWYSFGVTKKELLTRKCTDARKSS